MHIAETDFPCAHALHPRKPIVRVYKYRGTWVRKQKRLHSQVWAWDLDVIIPMTGAHRSSILIQDNSPIDC